MATKTKAKYYLPMLTLNCGKSEKKNFFLPTKLAHRGPRSCCRVLRIKINYGQVPPVEEVLYKFILRPTKDASRGERVTKRVLNLNKSPIWPESARERWREKKQTRHFGGHKVEDVVWFLVTSKVCITALFLVCECTNLMIV